VLAQIADELHAGRDRLLEAGRGLRSHPDAASQVDKTLASLREIASGLAATVSPLTHSVAHLEAFIPTLSQAARDLGSRLESPAVKSMAAETEAAAASLRALGDLAAPLVDSLSDLSQQAIPLADRLKRAAAPVAAAPVAAAPPPGSSAGAADWASDILRSVRDLSEVVKRQSPLGGPEGQKLWDSVRQIQVEIVNLQGALLAPAKKDPAP
jgi:hypothetical protein